MSLQATRSTGSLATYPVVVGEAVREPTVDRVCWDAGVRGGLQEKSVDDGHQCCCDGGLGLDASLLFDELFATGVSSFFEADVILAVMTLLTVTELDDELPRRSRVAVAVASLLGASVGLPLYLLLRERAVYQLALAG